MRYYTIFILYMMHSIYMVSYISSYHIYCMYYDVICKNMSVLILCLKNVEYEENECISCKCIQILHFCSFHWSNGCKSSLFILQLTVGWESRWRRGSSYHGHKRIDHDTRHEKSQSQPWESHRQLGNLLTVSSCWAILRNLRPLI